MNYQRLYESLISAAKIRAGVEGYFEKHHIIPKSLGGSNSLENIVSLTAREHFLAHYLLAKIHGKHLWLAVIRMKGKKENYTNSRLYEASKRKHSKVMSEKMKGSTLSESARLKIKNALLGNTNAEGCRSESSKENISKSLKGRKLSKEHIERVKLNAVGNRSKLGQKISEETRAKMSMAKTAKFQNVIKQFAFEVRLA